MVLTTQSQARSFQKFKSQLEQVREGAQALAMAKPSGPALLAFGKLHTMVLTTQSQAGVVQKFKSQLEQVREGAEDLAGNSQTLRPCPPCIRKASHHCLDHPIPSRNRAEVQVTTGTSEGRGSLRLKPEPLPSLAFSNLLVCPHARRLPT